MTTPKMMLAIVAGGVLLGTLGGGLASPVMKFAAKEHRYGSTEAQFSAAPAQFVDGGPEDLSPSGWYGPGYTQSAEYLQPATYVPPAAAGDYGAADYAPRYAPDYAAVDDRDVDPPAEVEQASADAADTAAAINEPQSAATEAAGIRDVPAQAPPVHEMATADKAL
jgi:hypothetical protein